MSGTVRKQDGETENSRACFPDKTHAMDGPRGGACITRRRFVEAAAKALAAVLLTMRGTPFVYQGEELGLTNVAWESIENYDDKSSRNQYEEALANVSKLS